MIAPLFFLPCELNCKSLLTNQLIDSFTLESGCHTGRLLPHVYARMHMQRHVYLHLSTLNPRAGLQQSTPRVLLHQCIIMAFCFSESSGALKLSQGHKRGSDATVAVHNF